MGLSVAGALIAITLSWLGQSPQLLRRLGFSGIRLDLRVRAFTGYALALLLLAVAFFLAGVPLGADAGGEALAGPGIDTTAAAGTSDDPDGPENSPTPEAPSATPATPETGAFTGPPAADVSAGSVITPDLAGATPSISDSGLLTGTPNVNSSQPTLEATPRPTETETPRPTETPLPSLTPTAIVGETAEVSTNGSTLWLKRSPGGQNLVLVHDGELVLIRAGRANQGGLLWREVATVSGEEGWLQEEFLILATAPEDG